MVNGVFLPGVWKYVISDITEWTRFILIPELLI